MVKEEDLSHLNFVSLFLVNDDISSSSASSSFLPSSSTCLLYMDII